MEQEQGGSYVVQDGGVAQDGVTAARDAAASVTVIKDASMCSRLSRSREGAYHIEQEQGGS